MKYLKSKKVILALIILSLYLGVRQIGIPLKWYLGDGINVDPKTPVHRLVAWTIGFKHKEYYKNGKLKLYGYDVGYAQRCYIYDPVGNLRSVIYNGSGFDMRFNEQGVLTSATALFNDSPSGISMVFDNDGVLKGMQTTDIFNKNHGLYFESKSDGTLLGCGQFRHGERIEFTDSVKKRVQNLYFKVVDTQKTSDKAVDERKPPTPAAEKPEGGK